MRLMCDGYLLESSCIGSPGLDELRLLQASLYGEGITVASIVDRQGVVVASSDPSAA